MRLQQTVKCFTYLWLIAVCLGVAAGTANATLIDFEAEGGSAPSMFTGELNSPLVIGSATFSGGQLLLDQVGGTDTTAVYATTDASPSGGAYLNPLTITFSQPISGFSIEITNQLLDMYTVADNQGGSQSLTVGPNVTQLFMLTDSNVTSVAISSASSVLWNFAIDNVQFTAAATTPEPSSLFLLLSTGGLIAAFLRRKPL